MQKNILLLGLLLTSSAFALNDGFNFSECSGSGSFEQQIEQYGSDYEKAITVGTIPKSIKGLHITLTSDKDVDIRLYGQNNDKIVHWPHGILNGSSENHALYQGSDIIYSGYNGTNGNNGHEFITVEGTTRVPMTMKAFGYEAGFATVNYSWTGKEGCNNSGDGNFTQSIEKDALSLVGEIPAGVPNLRIALTSDKDLDIQLYGVDGTVIVGWKPAGLLSGANIGTIKYKNMSIKWSGYNGTNGKKGHEYIQITGSTTKALTMKVYGYEAGFADVSYSWHENNTSTECTKELIPVCGYSPINGNLKTFQNRCLLEESNFTFGFNGKCNNKICTSWYDGCNSCSMDSTGNPICTAMVCIQKEDYVCHTWGTTPTPTPQPCITKPELQNKIISGEDVTEVNTSCITDMSELFSHADKFNQDISHWDVSHVTNMSLMFRDATIFNQDISKWDVSHVTNMSFMFSGATIFNQNISKWDVSHVTNMNDMFAHTNKFNQDISNWEVAQVHDMNGMFWEAKKFNQPIMKWNVSFDTYMPIMFLDATSFSQNLSNWHVVTPINIEEFAKGSLISEEHLPLFTHTKF